MSCRHLEMYLDSTNDDFESLLSEIGKEISMADIVTELGYGCTVDSTQCKEILSTFQPLDDVAISKLLGAVIGTQNSLAEAHNTYATFVSAIRNTHLSESPQLTTWNTDVLVDSINELVRPCSSSCCILFLCLMLLHFNLVVLSHVGPKY